MYTKSVGCTFQFSIPQPSVSWAYDSLFIKHSIYFAKNIAVSFARTWSICNNHLLIDTTETLTMMGKLVIHENGNITFHY